jgi:hypothetical protein
LVIAAVEPIVKVPAIVVTEADPLPIVASTSSSTLPSVIKNPTFDSPSCEATEKANLPPSCPLVALATIPSILAKLT